MRSDLEPKGFAPADGVALAYYRTGAGAPLLLINGGPGFPAQHFGPLADMLADRLKMKVIRFDPRGTGASVLPALTAEAFTFERLIDDIEHLRKHLGISSWVVLGHSFGALLGMAFAARHPSTTSCLVLSAPAGVDGGFMERLDAGIQTRLSPSERDALARLSEGPQDYRCRLDALSVVLAAYVYDPSNLPALRKAVVESRVYVPEVSALVWQNLEGFDLRASLQALSMEVLVLQGDDDPIGSETIDEICQAIPKARRITIPKSRHYPWVDNPESYLRAIGDVIGALPINRA